MEIELNPGQHAKIGTNPQTVRRQPRAELQKTMSFEQTNTLERSLKSTPQVRPDKVAHAVALAKDGNYPSDAQLSRLAGMLASRLGSQEF